MEKAGLNKQIHLPFEEVILSDDEMLIVKGGMAFGAYEGCRCESGCECGCGCDCNCGGSSILNGCECYCVEVDCMTPTPSPTPKPKTFL